MKQKTMKLWQMIIVTVVSLVLVITMFLPAFRINGDVLGDMVKSVTGNNIPGDLADSLIGDSIEEEKEKLDEEVKEYEEEHHVKISKISPFAIMTHSFSKLVLGDQITEEEMEDVENEKLFASIQKKYSILRFFLWAVYIGAAIIILITILGFLLKWNKMIPLIISTVYGVIGAIAFGYLRFFLIRSVVKKAGSSIMDELGVNFGGLGSEKTLSVTTKMLSCFYSVAFLIAFIAALCLILVSVLSMFLGKSEEIIEPHIEEGSAWDYYGNTPQPDENGIQGGSAENGYSQFPNPPEKEIPVTESGFQTPPVPKQPSVLERQPVMAAPMGQVKCTKGVMAGQGFMLPQDRKVIVGKNPQKANLVINNPKVSNIHCSIRYNPAGNKYIVKDHSTNGTFVNGSRLQKDTPQEYPAGTVLSLADGSNEITLG